MFTSDCIENLKNRDEQIELAKDVIINADSLSFASECLRWIRRDTEEHPNPKGFSDEEYTKLAVILAERISMELSNIDNIETDKIENLSFLLFIWSEYVNSNEASTTITRKIENDQYFVFSLLDTYTPTAFGEFGVKKSGFRRNNYDAIKNLVDPLVIVDAIEKVFYPEYLEVPRDEELARQFLWIHNNLLNEEANEHEQEKEL